MKVTTKILKVQITNGSHIEDYALIPRIELSPSDSLLPFKLSRRQCPVKLYFENYDGIYTNNVVYTEIFQ